MVFCEEIKWIDVIERIFDSRRYGQYHWRCYDDVYWLWRRLADRGQLSANQTGIK